jgi:two-component sensor histidine kinase
MNVLTYEDVQKQNFTKNHKESLGLGFLDNASVWIKFKLKNTSHTPIQKILNYNYNLLEKATLYDDNNTQQIGMFHDMSSDYLLTPYFHIHLQALEEKVFYIKVHSKFRVTYINLEIWNEQALIQKNTFNEFYFFAIYIILVTLLFYNLILFIFVKDKAYLYYVLYLSTFAITSPIHLGFLQLHILSQEMTYFLTQFFALFNGLLIYTIVQFSRNILQTRRFPKIDLVLKIHLYMAIILPLLACDNFLFSIQVLSFFLPLTPFIIFTAIYSLQHGIQEAKFYLLGWLPILFVLVLTVFISLGWVEATPSFHYFTSMAYILELFLFSITLAYRIKLLNIENLDKQHKLLELKKTEQYRLETLVSEKTIHISSLLKEKETLYQELNHRVKNNLLMILSLVKLQIARTALEETKEELLVTKNRIHSISHLYERLNFHELDIEVDTLSHFKNIIHNIQGEEYHKVKIHFDIQYNLCDDYLLYAGLILNELATNAFKYAFTDRTGVLTIALHKHKERITLSIKDDGLGFEMKNHSSLGLTIVQTLVENQLFGEIHFDTKEHTCITIQWDEEAK